MGDFNAENFVYGQTVSHYRDQQSKDFSNQIPLDSIQSMEVIRRSSAGESAKKGGLVIKRYDTFWFQGDLPHPIGPPQPPSYGSFGHRPMFGA